MISRRIHWCSACAAVVLGLLMIWPIFYGGIHTTHDIGEWYVPTRHFYAECLRNGDAFDWIPHVYCGYFLQGDGQVGMYHPLHWLLYRLLPLESAVQLELSIGFPVMLLGVFALLRRWRVARGPALFGGVIVAFSGYYMRHFEHMNAIQVLAHVPWMLVLIDIALRSADGRRAANAALGVALLTVSELLIGYPQYFWFSSFTEACYVLALLPSRPALGRLGWLAGCKLLGVFGGAVQLMPTSDLLSTSVRQDMSIEQRSSWPWHPLELLTLIAPYSFQPKILASWYPGVVPVMLVAWLLGRRRTRAWRRPVIVASAILLITVVLALGTYGLLYRLHLELPLIGVFRMPYRYLSIASLAFGVLAALGMHELTRTSLRPQAQSSRRFLLGLPLIGAAGIAAVAAIDMTDRLWYIERHGGNYLLAAAGLVALTLAAILIHRAERGHRGALGLLVLLAAVDLGAYGYSWVYRMGVPITLDEFKAAVPQPPDSDSRAIVAVGNQLVLHDVRISGGYMPMLPDAPLLQEIDEFGERSEPHLRVANIGWIQRQPGGDLWTQVSGTTKALRAQTRDFDPVPNRLPRARLLTESVVGAYPVRKTGEVDVARVAVVDFATELDPGPPGVATITSDRPGRIEVEVEAPGKQLLVVAERHRPGWEVFINGKHTGGARRVYGTFVGCVVEPDTERVEFRFQPDSLTTGKTRSAIGISLILCLLLAVNLWRRRGPAAGIATR